MDAKCWICGDEVASAEHKFKKSDIVRAFGSQADPESLVHFCKGRVRLIQGPNSKLLKYEKSLCAKCNNAGSQPFDRAYDNFITWILENEIFLRRERVIDFEKVYGDDWAGSQCNLFKYFIKALGCKIVDAGAPVPSDFCDLLEKDCYSSELQVAFAINNAVLQLSHNQKGGFVGFGNFYGYPTADDPSQLGSCFWQSHVSWLFIMYWYNNPPDGFGRDEIWAERMRYVRLGVID